MLCARTSPQSRDCVRVRSLRLDASPWRCVPLRRRYSARGARRTGGRLSGSSSAPRRVPPVGAVCARACAPPGLVGIPPVAIRRAFAAHPASRAVRGACLLLAVLRVLCAIGSAVLVRCGRETPAPTHRHIVRSAQSWRIMGSRRPGGSAMSDLSFPSAAKMAAVHKMPARSAVGRAAPARRLGGRASPRAAKRGGARPPAESQIANFCRMTPTNG